MEVANESSMTLLGNQDDLSLSKFAGKLLEKRGDSFGTACTQKRKRERERERDRSEKRLQHTKKNDPSSPDRFDRRYSLGRGRRRDEDARIAHRSFPIINATRLFEGEGGIFRYRWLCLS